MMTMLLLKAYCVGTVTSHMIERAYYEDLAFRVLTVNQQPDKSRISEFRQRNLGSALPTGIEAFSKLATQSAPVRSHLWRPTINA